ncbi:adenylate cyclase [Pelomyxa schiedti]|nr:adenylate cyclase [Pelomyxa schiedti]
MKTLVPGVNSNRVSDASTSDDGGGDLEDGSAAVEMCKFTGSTASIHLNGIGRPIESSQIIKRRGKLAGAFSLMAVVPLVAALVVVIIIAVSLAPTTALWVASLRSLSGTCSSSISKEMDVYRNLLVEKSVSNISSHMSIPPTVAYVVQISLPEAAYTSPVPLHTDHSVFQSVFRGLAKHFSAINNMFVGWVNDQGEHFYIDRQQTWGMYDSCVDSNISLFYIRNGEATNEKAAPVTNYNLTVRAWWTTGLSAWTGSWTSVYMSVNPDDGRLIGYTLRPPFDVPVVIQVTYSTAFLQEFFKNFNLTKHGLAFLLENGSLKIVAGTTGIPILTDTGGDTFALTSTDDTVRDAAAKWLNMTGPTPVESHFTMMMVEEGISFVDVVPITASGGLVLWLFLVTPEKDFMQEIQEEQTTAVDDAYFSLWVVLGVEVVIAILAVVISITLALVLARALSAVISKLKKVSSGQLTKRQSSNDLKTSMLREIDSLNSEVTSMQSALESFSQYVPTQVVRYLCKNHMKPIVGVTKMHCTVMFLDIVDFTHTMEQYGAQTVLDILSTMFESFSTIISKNDGCIDKYIGDAIMALWGCPVVDPNSELKACHAIAEILADLDRINVIFKTKSYPTMRIRIGLHSGEVNAGNVGSSQRLNFTVLGSTVNLASRLEPLNKELHTSVLVTDSIRDAVWAATNSEIFTWRAIGHIQVRGIKVPVLVHEFLGFTANLSEQTARMVKNYSGIDRMLYHGKKGAAPADITTAIDEYLEDNPDDFAATQARKMLANIRASFHAH